MPAPRLWRLIRLRIPRRCLSVLNGTVTTTFEYHTCETLGLVKMDFLGLSNLTVIRDTITNIENNGKPSFNIQDVPIDDKETYKLLSRRYARRVPA